MTIIILLICISLTVAVVFLIAFIWSMKSGQFDDVDGPSIRMLKEERKEKTKEKDKKN